MEDFSFRWDYFPLKCILLQWDFPLGLGTYPQTFILVMESHRRRLRADFLQFFRLFLQACTTIFSALTITWKLFVSNRDLFFELTTFAWLWYFVGFCNQMFPLSYLKLRRNLQRSDLVQQSTCSTDHVIRLLLDTFIVEHALYAIFLFTRELNTRSYPNLKIGSWATRARTEPELTTRGYLFWKKSTCIGVFFA